MDHKKRSHGHEREHAHRHESEFKLLARRNKRLGLWLAAELGIADGEAYAKDVVISDLDEPGDDDVVRKVMSDIAGRGAAVTEEQVRAKMAALLKEVKLES